MAYVYEGQRSTMRGMTILILLRFSPSGQND